MMVESEREHSVRLMELQRLYNSMKAELQQQQHAQRDLHQASASNWHSG